jgi:hypothetical protein
LRCPSSSQRVSQLRLLFGTVGCAMGSYFLSGMCRETGTVASAKARPLIREYAIDT